MNKRDKNNLSEKQPVKRGEIKVLENDPGSPSDEEWEECSVCLQSHIYPVLLPCKHIFCFLCIKGAAQRDRRCALCRTEIPNEFFKKPQLLSNFKKKVDRKEVAHRWYYEGRGGWWQYDERSNKDIEERFINKEKKFEVQIAGSLYIIDIEAMQQINRCDPSRRRKIKRGTSSDDLKGIAGLKISNDTVTENTLCDRGGADGGSAEDTTASRASTVISVGSARTLVTSSSSGGIRRREADGTDRTD